MEAYWDIFFWYPRNLSYFPSERAGSRKARKVNSTGDVGRPHAGSRKVWVVI